MRKAARWLGRFLLVLGVVIGGVWLFGPREPVEATPFDTVLTAQAVEAYFAKREARFDDITPGTQKRVIWAGEAGMQTPVSVLYVHGFSATSEDIRPVPDDVAKALGANLVFTRLTGHGRGGAALAQATAGDWITDMAEALAAARAVGDKVIVIATSTGGTLAALAAVDATQSKGVKGIAFISPNFAIANPMARLLTWPSVRWWATLVAGETHSLDVRNDQYRAFWTTTYPTLALLPMAALVKHTVAQDFSGVSVPALFIYSPNDTVVSPAATQAVAARWGGRALLAPQTVPAGNDRYHHVIAGDILSPGMTDIVVAQIVKWAEGL